MKGCFPHPLQCACSPAIHNAFFPYDSSQGVEQKPALQAGLVYGVFLLMSPGLWLFWGGSWQCGGFPIEFVTPGCIPALAGLSASACGLSLGCFIPEDFSNMSAVMPLHRTVSGCPRSSLARCPQDRLCSSQSLGAVSVQRQNRSSSVLKTPCREAEQWRVAGPWWPWCRQLRPGDNPGLSN